LKNAQSEWKELGMIRNQGDTKNLNLEINLVD